MSRQFIVSSILYLITRHPPGRTRHSHHILPHGLFASHFLPEPACPFLNEAGRIRNALLLAQLLEIRQGCPRNGDDSDDGIQGAEHQGLEGVPVLVDADLRRVLVTGLGRKDEKPEAQPCIGTFPLGVYAAPVKRMRAAYVGEKKEEAQRGLSQTPGALQENIEETFQRMYHVLFRSTNKAIVSCMRQDIQVISLPVSSGTPPETHRCWSLPARGRESPPCS